MILDELENFKPLNNFTFGHTPFQIEHFKTTAQKGSRHFEYLHHLVQLKSLYKSLKEICLDIDDLKNDIVEHEVFFPFWTRRCRRRKLPRLRHRLSLVEDSYREKKLEATRTFELIKTKFQDCLGLSEEEILASETQYWVNRLVRQVKTNQLALKLGCTPGDVNALQALPEEAQKLIFNELLAIGDGR